MDDDLMIPDFLRRDPSEVTTLPKTIRAKRPRKIPYPKDGYKCVGMRQAARERHKEKLRRKAERARQRRPVK